MRGMRLMRSRQAGFSVTEIAGGAGHRRGIGGDGTSPRRARTLADVRLSNDARALHNLLSLAKMRAAASTRATGPPATWARDVRAPVPTTRPPAVWTAEEGGQTLSTNVDFRFDALATPQPDTQARNHQAAACKAKTDDPTSATPPASSSIRAAFHSMPPAILMGTARFYVTDNQTGVYGVTVSATPLVRLWWSPAATTAWAHK